MSKKSLIRILIVVFVLSFGTQLLFGEVVCDLFRAMPCCDGDQVPVAPRAPASTNQCCVITAPETSNNFTGVPESRTGHSEKNFEPCDPDVLAFLRGPALNETEGFNSSQSPPAFYSNSETLSVFRI